MEFKLIHQIVKNIQDTIFNTGRAVVDALKPHTFSTKVKNFPKVQKINGIVTVSNQKRVETELKTATIVQKSVLKWLKNLKIPTKMEISNFPNAAKQLPFPKKMEISNFPKPVEPIKNIRVSNQPTKEIREVAKGVGMVEKAIKALKLSPPIIKVTAPKAEKIIVPAPKVVVTQEKIDYVKLAKLMPAPAKELDYKKLSKAIAKEIAGMIVSVGGGGRRKEGQDDLTREYNVSDKDSENLIRYYGFVGRSGQWYILKENTTTQEYRYVKGSSGYEENWTGRADLEYGYYHEVF